MKDAAAFHDKKRLFYSNLMNDNILDCIISKVNIVKIPPAVCFILRRSNLPHLLLEIMGFILQLQLMFAYLWLLYCL